MPRLIAKCPNCGAKKNNEVKNFIHFRLDMGTAVVCTNCHLRFCATLSDKDVDALFEPGSITPIIKGEEDYVLEGVRYPKF